MIGNTVISTPNICVYAVHICVYTNVYTFSVYLLHVCIYCFVFFNYGTVFNFPVACKN